jgi:hypothetical protein
MSDEPSLAAWVDTILDRTVKQAIRQSPFFKKMFAHYEVSPKELWRLRFRTADPGEPTSAKADEIRIGGEDWGGGISGAMHVVASQLADWLAREREKKVYFTTVEKAGGLHWAVAHELAAGHSADQIEDAVRPMLANNPGQSLPKLMAEAQRLLK